MLAIISRLSGEIRAGPWSGTAREGCRAGEFAARATGRAVMAIRCSSYPFFELRKPFS